MKYLLMSFIFILVSCAHNAPAERILSDAEMAQHNLTGTIHSVEICQNTFNNKSQQLVITGPCEIISCQELQKKIICKAKPKP